MALGRGAAPCFWKLIWICIGCAALSAAWPATAEAQQLGAEGEADYDPQSSFSVNGMLRLQAGVFAPLVSDRFRAHRNEAYEVSDGRRLRPCDPVAEPYAPCLPVDHGQRPGSLSIARATLQLEAHWEPSDQIALHAILRGVRSLELPADAWAQVPEPPLEPSARRDYAQSWVHDNYYTEFDLRELYLTLTPVPWLSLRVGRQQVAWGETTSFRLLDVVNPTNNSWHFGPLEAYEDMRIPLWMLHADIELVRLGGSLELLWIPLLDRPRDTVTTPLTFAGAWGLPYSNTPTNFFTARREFRYPGGELSDSRVGARWKGTLGAHGDFSLVYLYTHQISLPVPTYFIQALREDGSAQRLPGSQAALVEVAVLEYPRQHIAGFTFDYALDSPIGTLLRAEASIEPNRTYPNRTDNGALRDPRDPARYNYQPSRELVINYALSAQRSTLIRFLNPTQSFLLFAQFLHSVVPTLEPDGKDANLVEVPIYNAWQAQKHTFSFVAQVRTSYLRGALSPRLTGAWLPNRYAGDSGFCSFDVDIRLSTHYLLNLRVTEFIGRDAYRELGLFRDRDELSAAFTVQY